jgi:3-hydroxyisobutyrate dehydrogenase-like beta-hydroxyacid dehydrogenase
LWPVAAELQSRLNRNQRSQNLLSIKPSCFAIYLTTDTRGDPVMGSSAKKVTFIGLGNMGSNIANCLLAGGIDLTVWNRTASKMTPLIERGAKPAASAKEAARGADVVLTSLTDDQSVLDTLQGDQGILAGLPPGSVHVCLATISPRCADELEQIHTKHGSFYISGPVVGPTAAAASGQLLSYVAGDPAAIERARPVCMAYSKQVIAISERPSIANCMKLAINFNVVSTLELIGESYAFAEKCGIPLACLRDFYQQMWFAHPGPKMYAEKLRARDFGGGGGFVMKGGLKDVRLMLATAEANGIQLETANIVERKLRKGIEAGMEDADWSAFYEITRREAGLP